MVPRETGMVPGSDEMVSGSSECVPVILGNVPGMIWCIC
jgi:hypothetical protein